ncbi:MAG: GntR family transcriptional regulator [Caulobacteraceae bacterium]
MALAHAQPLPDLVYQAVRERILSGDLAAGKPVRQDTLAGELGVSKIPVREALNRLERDGLLLSNPRRGYEVRPLTSEEAEEVFDLRLQVEPAAAALASARANPADHAAARAALEALNAAMARGEPASDLNRAFHLSLVRPAGRALTTDLVDRLHVLADRYVRAHLAPEGRPGRAAAEHAALLAAWTAARADEVEARLSDHIIETLNDLKGQL